MKRIGLLLCVATICTPANAEWSERLVNAALADHFTRHYCTLKRPAMKQLISEAFEHSRLKGVEVACSAFTCENAEHTEGMTRLLLRAGGMAEAELTDMCATYPATLKEIEQEFRDELVRGGDQKP